MFNTFAEYMWYLLFMPLKKIKKAVNSWYIWCRILGAWFDQCKADLLKSRAEGMVATSSSLVLNLHGLDRELTRYNGEDIENFRQRIAMYEEVCRLGGTDQGILLAVRTLGYDHIELQTAKERYQEADRWAEFYVILNMEIDEEQPISFRILQKNVRIWKEVGAKDNYLFSFHNQFRTSLQVINREVLRCFSEIEDKVDNTAVYNCNIENPLDSELHVTVENDLWYFNGEYDFDGGKKADAYITREDF